MPSRFLIELGYNPYGVSFGSQVGAGRDKDGDGFSDFEEEDFEGDFDPFPEDLPVFE